MNFLPKTPNLACEMDIPLTKITLSKILYAKELHGLSLKTITLESVPGFPKWLHLSSWRKCCWCQLYKHNFSLNLQFLLGQEEHRLKLLKL